MSAEPTPLTTLDQRQCVCSMGEDCCCPPTERVLRQLANHPSDIVLNDQQREWCLKQIDRVEGYRREDYQQENSSDLARGVLDAWTDYCRDKGLM